jgi:putative hydrolase of the HAD superfamily
VGDSLGTDVLGANNAGMVSIWLNRRGVQNGTGILPCHEVRSLTGILGILQ